ncbi:toxic anion resistance protein [Zavarzinia compransoris]|uniref:toxic anion resistance protein n=1 Tax=Zavarzinia marina TaxID=2911065 RepID=UPI001F4387F8|nr:toxic anion resistance protein [Zavarzinia marina]MCF4165319.1 toxic anion resistance protein [Zavarzinia marina]
MTTIEGEIPSPRAAAALPVVMVDPDRVAVIAGGIDLGDRAQLASFGDVAQRSVTAYADKILAQTRNKEMGETGKLLIDIIEKAKGLDPASLKNAGFFERLFSSLHARVRRFAAQFEDVASQIDGIVIELDRHKDRLKRDIAVLDDLHEETLRSIGELDTFIAAGKNFAETYRTAELTRLKASAEAAAPGGDAMLAAQAYQDAVQALDRLEKRVYYLQQARQIGIQQLPQIRIVQSGDETLIENLQATAQLTVPVWKQKMIVLLGLTRQQQALELQKTVTDATNEMLKQASEMMKDQAIAIEEQSQRGIVDIETLEQTNRDLIDTIGSVLRVQEDGRRKRAEAEQRMEAMTGDLQRSLIADRA